MTNPPSDSDLLESLRHDDIKAFDRLYSLYWESMYRAAVGRLKSQDLAEDIVQEIFIDLWNRRKSLHITSSLKVYLLTAVKYKVFRLVDSMYRHESLEELGDLRVGTTEDLLEFEEVYHLIEVSLDKLPKTHSTIFRMNKLEGLSVQEISEKVDMAPQSVYNTLSKTTKFLKKELKGYYGIF